MVLGGGGGGPDERGTSVHTKNIFLASPAPTVFHLCILVYLMIYDPGQVSLEHLMFLWYPSQGACPPQGYHNSLNVNQEALEYCPPKHLVYPTPKIPRKYLEG